MSRRLGPVLRYARLEVRRTLRDAGYVITSVAMPLTMYLLFTNLGASESAADRADYARYAMVGMAAYGALGAALGIGTGVADDKGRGWLRQLRVTPLTPAQVVAGRALTASVTVLPALVTVLGAGAAVNGVRLAAWQWAAVAGLLWLGTFPFTLLGLGNGYGLSAQATGVASMASMMGLSVIGGLWIPVALFPRWLAAVSRWTPTRRFGDLGWSVLDHRGPSLGTVAVLGGWLLLFGGYAVVAYRRGARTA
ncbi:ABC transporter permease [Actinacidiphila rubida]|uniref:ABC-2 type transport system permease protein n=1 Tax=Actinacidiphila rubida TaxID=310780 RepID=A0A1H8FFG6_9ACTN|nr:ABC transporter permease [Actinacidiphila rubida]SEN30350.1 ABC-2 type transport system permease protein [Actinacidiphila rubida]